MKAVVAAFNQEVALVGAFSVIVKTDGSFAALVGAHRFTSLYLVMLVSQFPGAEEDKEEGEGEAGDHQPHARDHLDVLAGQAVRQEELLI